MGNSLFSLSAEYQRVMDILLSKEEIDAEMEESFSKINDELENKILNYVSIIKMIDAEADSIDKAVQSMLNRIDRLCKKSNYLKEKVKTEMENCKIEGAKNPYHEVKIILNNPKVNDTIDQNLLPEKYFKETVYKTIDRTKILKDLKQGVEIPGATMVRNTRLSIK